MPESDWGSFVDSYSKSFGGFGLLDADGFAADSPAQIYSYLRDLFYVNSTSSVVIRLLGWCHPVFITLLVHAARRMPLHDAFTDTVEHEPPPICVWLTPKAYLDLEEYRHVILRSVGYSNVAYFRCGQSIAPPEIERTIIRESELQSHSTVLRHVRLEKEPWHTGFDATCGSFPLFDTPYDAVLAAHMVTGWGDYSKRWIYRGQADYRWSFSTTHERGSSLETKHGVELTPDERSSLLKSFAAFLKTKANPSLQMIVGKGRQLEALAQHHGLPTNLLDFSYNPYVAISFAANRPSSSPPGCLFCINLKEYGEFINPYSVFQELGLNDDTPTADEFRNRHPNWAIPDTVLVEMPDWERRIARQEGLFLDGANLKLVFSNLIDRYYFKHGPIEVDPQWCGVDLNDLFDDEPWVEQLLEEFVTKFVAAPH